VEFSFTLSAGNLIFVVGEGAVQQFFLKLFISPPLLYIPCHQGILQLAI
jgi:hypothetical protein